MSRFWSNVLILQVFWIYRMIKTFILFLDLLGFVIRFAFVSCREIFKILVKR